jgi:hypothetical protein
MRRHSPAHTTVPSDALPTSKNAALRRDQSSPDAPRANLSRQTVNRIRDTNPVAPFAFRDERSERVAHFILTEGPDQLLKLTFDFVRDRRC